MLFSFIISIVIGYKRKTINKMQMRVQHFQARIRQTHEHTIFNKTRPTVTITTATNVYMEIERETKRVNEKDR